MKQLQNLKYRESVKEGKTKAITIEDLQRYADAHGEVPEDVNKPFVVNFSRASVRRRSGDKTLFCMVWTTAKLMGLQCKSKMIQLDATYKVTWHGFPFFVSSQISVVPS